jgi:hypothetical protein
VIRRARTAHLRRCCLQARDRTCGGNAETVGTRFDRDRAAAGPLPVRPFEACVYSTGAVDKYQTVAFDGNRYSVPRRHAFQAVTVKGFVDRVEVVADHRVVATHPRSYGSHERVLNPLHFLVVLEQKPAALDHAPVYRDWLLPPIFATLRTRLEGDLGPRAGVRQYIRVLQLLARLPLDTVAQAVAHQLARGDPTAPAVAAAADRLAVGITRPPPNAPAVTVPRPDLTRFNQLLPRPEGGPDDRRDAVAAEGQPEAVEAADHAGRARQAEPGGGRP